jgi:hypothetical protein
MTNKELIALLKTFPEGAPIYYTEEIPDLCPWTVEEVTKASLKDGCIILEPEDRWGNMPLEPAEPKASVNNQSGEAGARYFR